MKKVLKNLAILAVCIFTFTVISSVCTQEDFGVQTAVESKVIVPKPNRTGRELEGILVG